MITPVSNARQTKPAVAGGFCASSKLDDFSSGSDGDSSAVRTSANCDLA